MARVPADEVTSAGLHHDFITSSRFITSTPRQRQQSTPPTDAADAPRCAPRLAASHNANSNHKQESLLRTAGRGCSAMARILLVLNSRCAAARTPHTSTTQDTSGTSGAALRKTPRAPTKTPRCRRPHFSRHAIPPPTPPPINPRHHRPNLGTPARGGGQANVVPASAARSAPVISF